ncbi:MAG: hypothetical protein BWY31_01643 [Lentisphaerae bacterium ADurb.Bin242]|nr:MAG: hypothetical protein BWY31_01643 [Lentisphaerae bacterium ADurb.Bin242]
MKCCVKKCFTMIELLVVISVIAILAGLLLPALAVARAKAHEIACVANMKNWSLAFSAYNADFNEFFPPCEAAGGGERIWVKLLSTGTDKKIGNGWVKSLGYLPEPEPASGKMICEPTRIYLKTVGVNLLGYYYSYAYFAGGTFADQKLGLGGTTAGKDMPKIAYIRSPLSRTALLGEQAQCANIFNVGANGLAVYPIGRHGKNFERANQLFVDGHVQSYPSKVLNAVASRWNEWNPPYLFGMYNYMFCTSLGHYGYTGATL